MKRKVLHLFVSFVCMFAFIGVPLTATAEGPQDAETGFSLPNIIITEVQTSSGTGGASQEFIELYNTTDQEIVFGDEETPAGWQLWYLPASRTLENYNDHTALTLTGSIPAHAHFLLAKGFTDLNPEDGAPDIGGYLESKQVDQVSTLGMAASGSLWLVGPDVTEPCKNMRYDALGWGTAVLGEGVSIGNPEGGTGLARLAGTEGEYVDTARNSLDFTAAAAVNVTPRVKNLLMQDAAVELPSEGWEELNAPTLLDDSTCEADPPAPPANPPMGGWPPSILLPPEGEDDDDAPTIPAANAGLKAPQLSELLPNPAKPQTDANDEFVEIYNPNDAPFDLSGYVLEAGTGRTHRHTFAEGTILKPKTFLAVFSGESSLTLSNSSGQARLLDPLGNVLAQSDLYESAKDNQAWVNANGTWQWTAKPTPNAVNIVQAPASADKRSSKKSSVKTASSAKSSSSGGTGGGEENSEEFAAVAATGSPLHPGLLALVGGFALLYGAYEYRHDVANKIRNFRTNRAARLAARQGAKGR